MSQVRVLPGEPNVPTIFDAPIGCHLTHCLYLWQVCYGLVQSFIRSMDVSKHNLEVFMARHSPVDCFGISKLLGASVRAPATIFFEYGSLEASLLRVRHH